MKRAPDMDNVWIIHAERLTNSVNGNPRYILTFTDGDLGSWTYQTKSDASCSYDVDNFVRSRERINVWLTKADRVDVMEKAT